MHISFEKGVSSSEDVPADTTTDAPSETQLADGHAPEDGSEPIAKGAPETKKDVLPKTVSDGKLVKGMLARFVGHKNICQHILKEKKKKGMVGGVGRSFSMQKAFSLKASKRNRNNCFVCFQIACFHIFFIRL